MKQRRVASHVIRNILQLLHRIASKQSSLIYNTIRPSLQEREREKAPLSYDSVGKSLQWQPMTDNLLKKVKERVETGATQQLGSEEYDFFRRTLVKNTECIMDLGQPL